MQSNNVAKTAYKELYGQEWKGKISIEYSGRFKAYNAKIVQKGRTITIKASKQWKEVSEEIQKGLIHELLGKLTGRKKNTLHMELYSNFIKNLSSYTEANKTHPILEDSFIRVNEKNFNNELDRPNLRIGKGTMQLGKYEYATNTITISKILLEDLELVDYVMYHELLHKKLKFTTKNGRHNHHSKEFREKEKEYPNYDMMEKRLEKTVTKARRRNNLVNKFPTKKWF